MKPTITPEELTKLATREIAARIHGLRWSIGPNGENYKHNEEEAKPLVEEYNKRGREIAKKYKRPWRTLTFRGFPRTY